MTMRVTNEWQVRNPVNPSQTYLAKAVISPSTRHGFDKAQALRKCSFKVNDFFRQHRLAVEAKIEQNLDFEEKIIEIVDRAWGFHASISIRPLTDID